MEKQQQLSQNKPLLTIPTLDSPSNNDVDLYLNSFPPGYRFHPSDEELIVEYLTKRVNNQELPPNRIHDVDLYKHNPNTLAEQYKSSGEQEWFFFTPRTRKYRNGQRPNRAAGDGYWKATGADKPVKVNGTEVGSRKALVHYVGKPPNGVKSCWIMHEFRVRDSPQTQRGENHDMRLDDWVLCKIYKKSDKTTNTRDDDDAQTHSEAVTSSQHPNGFPSVMSDNSQSRGISTPIQVSDVQNIQLPNLSTPIQVSDVQNIQLPNLSTPIQVSDVQNIQLPNPSTPIQIPSANGFPSMRSADTPSTDFSTPDQTPHANGFSTTTSENNLSSGFSTPAQAQAPPANGFPSMMPENYQSRFPISMFDGYSLPTPYDNSHYYYPATLPNVYGEVALTHSLPSHFDSQSSSIGLSSQGTGLPSHFNCQPSSIGLSSQGTGLPSHFDCQPSSIGLSSQGTGLPSHFDCQPSSIGLSSQGASLPSHFDCQPSSIGLSSQGTGLPSHFDNCQPSSIGLSSQGTGLPSHFDCQSSSIGLSSQGTDPCVDAEHSELATILSMDQYLNYDGSLPDNL